MVHARLVGPGIEHAQAHHAVVVARRQVRDIRAGAEPHQDHAAHAVRAPEVLDRVAGLEWSALLEREIVAPRLAVADAREIESQGDEAGLGEAAGELYVQPVRADVVQDAGVEQDHGNRLAYCRPRGLREHAG